MKFTFYKPFLPVLLLGVAIGSYSCSENDSGAAQTMPFKSIAVKVDNETAEAKPIDEKNLSLSFEAAENFSSAKLEIDLNEGYEVIFPEDLTNADLANYPVINFRAPDNKIIKYWFAITSKAFPIIDETKIYTNGNAGNITVKNSTKEVIVNFDKNRMDMSSIQLHFEEGSLMNGAVVEGNLNYDFTQGLSQDLIIKLGGADRRYNVTLNVASAVDDPKNYGFTNVTSDFVDVTTYPFISVYEASSIIKVPVKNNAPETPWSWDVPESQLNDYLAFIGDWTANRAIETVNNLQFSIATIDLNRARAELVSNEQMQITPNSINSLIVMSGIPIGESTMLYWNGKVLNSQNTEGAPWRSAAGFDAEGNVSFYNAALVNDRIIKLGYNPAPPSADYINTGTEWDVMSAACGHPWLVRNGHLMTRDEMYWNDGTGWEVGLGEAWNGGERSRSFIGVTYENKLGCAVVSTGLSICQAAWILNKLGWKDVFYIGGSYYKANDFQTTLCVNGKLASGNQDQQSQYCIAIDVKD